MDLDGTVLDETFQPSARTRGGDRARRGLRHRLPDRDRPHVRLGAPHRREARHPPAARLLPGRARRRSGHAARCSCTGRSRRRWRARSCARCPSEHARRSNLYIDDELYVWEENDGDAALLAGRGRRRCTSSARPGRLARAADHEDRDRRRARRRWTRCATSCSRSSAAARSSPSRCRTSSSSPRPASRRRAGSRCVADLLGFTAEQASPSATPRTTARCSTGRAAAWRSRTPTSACSGEADAVIPSVHDDGVAQLLEALAAARAARLERMLDIRLIRSDTERVRAALARREADGLLDEVLALDERRRALQTQVDELRAERNTRGAGDRRGQARRARRRRRDGGRGRAARPAGGARGARCARPTPPSRRRCSRCRTCPHESAADGMLEEDAQLHDMSERPKPEFDFEPRDHLDLAGPHDRHRARRAHVGLALRLPARRPRAAAPGDGAVRARQARRQGLHAGHDAGARARGGARRQRLLPRGARAGLRGRERRSRAVPGRHVGGLAGRAAHGRDPGRGRPAAALLRALVVLPARGRRGGQGHARHLPHAPVRQGRDVLVLPSRPILGGARAPAHDRARDRGRARAALPRHEHRGRRPRRAGRQEVRHRGLAARARAATASSRPARTRPTTRPAASTPATAARRASATCTRSTARRSRRRAR